MSLSLVLAITAKANGPVRESVSPGPEEPIVGDSAPSAGSAEVAPAVLNIDFDLAKVTSSTPASDAVRNSVRDYLREHPDCADQKYRYCEVYVPSAPASGNVECEDGYTFYSNDVIGLNIQRRSSPPRPKGMDNPEERRGASLDDLVRTHRAHATLIGVCRKI